MPVADDANKTVDVPSSDQQAPDSGQGSGNSTPQRRDETVVSLHADTRPLDATEEIPPAASGGPGVSAAIDALTLDTRVLEVNQDARREPEDKTLDLGSSRCLPVTLDSAADGFSLANEVDAMTVAVKPAPVPSVAGYQLLSVLGRGGMGVVYKARQEKLNRLVALKMVLAGAHASPQQLARFYTEAEAVARLQHPNIVQIYEVGECEGLPFFSLEYVGGGTLTQQIDGKPRPPREAAATVELLAGAMAVAHERGIMHRDLKPANVLLTPDGQPKITDFGLAKRIEDDSSQTKSGTLMGTPSYMSPEQARGETRNIGPLADQYSLGAILYELLTGRPPFVGPTVLDTLFQVRNQEPVPPSRLQPKCPRDLETICLKCLQKEPQKRYASCQALADDLHCFLVAEPIKARPVGWVERTWRWCRRNPRLTALGTCVGVLLLAVIASISVMVIRMARERETLAETRKLANERIAQAAEQVAGGDFQHAQTILKWSDPLLSNADLADVRTELDALRAKVNVYANFRNLLDSARFACRFGSLREKEEGKRSCEQLRALYKDIEQRTGPGWAGLPRLSDPQQQLFKEDVFEALLTSAQVEQELAAGNGDVAERQAAARALDSLNQAEQILPGTRALYVHRAPCFSRLGHKKAAQADMDKARAIAPTSAVDHFWHGFAEHKRGDEALRKRDVKTANEHYRKEIEQYAAFLQQRPDHYWGYFNWANAHVQLLQRADAYDALIGFTTCIRLRPDFPWPYNNRGTVHLRLGQPELALADLNAALARSQNYTEAYANRGLAYLALKKPDRAVEDLNVALKVDPNNLQVRARRAEGLVAQQKYAEARADFTTILEKAPRELEIWRARAIVEWQNLKDFDAALADFKKCTELAPENAEAFRCIGVILLGRRQYAAALDALQEALTLRPEYPEAIWARVQIYFNQRQYDKALEELDPLIARLPDGPPESLNVRAGVYRAMGKLKEAAADYEHMIQVKPKEREAYVCLARVYDQQGDSAAAAASLERLMTATGSSAWSLVRRAEFRRDHRQFDAADKDCDQAAKLAPGWAVPALVLASVQAARGEGSAAVGKAEGVLKKVSAPDGHVLYAAACVWSLAAATSKDPGEKKRYAERAADLLTETLNKGYHDLIYPEHQRIPHDPALTSIRGLPRVRALLGGGQG
jgi:tetratricopeptide (TPR) repeat protein/tRNA A-37 threonylcarbamoyl transferase component Bud32